MNNGAMLNAYPDSLGGCLGGAAALISRPEFADVFRSFYVLPGSSAFSKSSLYIWKFSVHILLKPSLMDFEHYLASM